MAVEIVTGYTGEPHVTSDMERARNAAAFGAGTYILSTKDGLAANMENANAITIAAGDLMMQGTHITNERPVTLTVENGVSGQNRNDLVVMRYTRDEHTGIEAAALHVIKGTPTAGTAQDPQVTEGIITEGASIAEVALYRIPISGISPGAPVQLVGYARAMTACPFPVGYVIANVTGNPCLDWPGTVWVPYAQGRAIIGHDEGSAAYSALGALVGSPNLQAHAHGVPEHTHAIDEAGSHLHGAAESKRFVKISGTTDLSEEVGSTISGTGYYYPKTKKNLDWSAGENTMEAGAHSHTASATALTTSTHNQAQGDAGNIPPSIVTYYWKRTA